MEIIDVPSEKDDNAGLKVQENWTLQPEELNAAIFSRSCVAAVGHIDDHEVFPSPPLNY